MKCRVALFVYALVVTAVSPALAEESSTQTGTIAGRIVWEGKPYAAEKVYLSHIDLANGEVLSYDDTETDAEGRFSFKYLAPGFYQVAPVIAYRSYDGYGSTPSGTTTHYASVWLESGETEEVSIGGTGVTVAGRLKVEDDKGRAVSFQQCDFARLTRNVDWVERPEGQTEETFNTWIHESGFLEGWLSRTNMFVFMDGKGGFRALDVPPGGYYLSIDILGTEDPQEVVGTASAQVTVPDLPDGETYDIGEVPVSVYVMLEEGQAAPPFSVSSLDGEALKLSDLKGKYTVLQFWATWCGPCRAELPALKEIWKKYGDRKDFAMVGLSLDDDAEAHTAFLKKEALDWQQARLGAWNETKLPETYGFQGIPALYLVNPEGKLVVVNGRAEEIGEKLEEAMGG